MRSLTAILFILVLSGFFYCRSVPVSGPEVTPFPEEVSPTPDSSGLVESAFEPAEEILSTPVASVSGSSEIVDIPEKTPEPVMPVIKKFNIKQAISQIPKHFEHPVYPLRHNGEIYFISHDLDGDGAPEIFVPGVETEKQAFADFDYVSDITRIFSNEKVENPFYLYVFSETDDHFSLINRIFLGKHQVMKSCMKFFAGSHKGAPVIISSTFQTRESSIQKWCLFVPPRLKQTSVLEFSETIFRKVVIEDIDGDEIIDLVIQEKSIEEGLGIETYFTWLKWNGTRFAEYRHTNIVRNLNQFLSRFKELFLAGKREELLNFAVAPDLLPKESGSFSLRQLLGITEKGELGYDTGLLGGVKDIALPEILDNPFIISNNRGYYFHLTFRITYQNHISVIADAPVYLLKNPFIDKPFTFYPNIIPH